MVEKERILGVDYGEEVHLAAQRGEQAGADHINRVMDDAVSGRMTAVCWRITGLGRQYYPTRVGTPANVAPAAHGLNEQFDAIFKHCDPLETAIRAAHARNLAIEAYLTIFDEAYGESESRLGRRHPEYYIIHHDGQSYVRGLFSLAYEEVQCYFLDLIREALAYNPDGIYLDVARTHAGGNPIPVHGWWPQWTNPYLGYGYNEPDVKLYRDRYGEEPPVIRATDIGGLEAEEKSEHWAAVRGEALTSFLRKAAALVHSSGKKLCVGFYPSTYNGFFPGYHTRQMLGRYQIDWPTWVTEGLLDAIRLIVDHRKTGYDDWIAHSAETYAPVQRRGIKLLLDCATEGVFDRLENSPVPLPIKRSHDPQSYYRVLRDTVARVLRTSADGICFYEHAGGTRQDWEVIAAAVDEYMETQ